MTDSFRFITIIPGPHRALLALAQQAVKQADDAQMPVRFAFHHVTATVMPGDTADAVLADWTDDYDSRQLVTEGGRA